MGTLFSGVKPTGELQIGNYLGALKNWVALQDTYSCIYSIVDWHALTIAIEPDELRANTTQAAIDLLSLGIDPKRTILFRQSDVHEHVELGWLFDCLTPMGELSRMTQFKDETRNAPGKANAGLFTYPALMAADILLYRAAAVPVGEDQLQHLELTRIIARKFNSRYHTDLFPEPKPVLSEAIRVMSLTDPDKKMSKSHGSKSYLALKDSPDDIRKKISKAVTDSLDTNDTLSGGHNLLTIFKGIGDLERYEHFHRQHKLKELSYVELKKELAEAVVKHFASYRDKRAYYETHLPEVKAILTDGATRARAKARETMALVRTTVGLE